MKLPDERGARPCNFPLFAIDTRQFSDLIIGVTRLRHGNGCLHGELYSRQNEVEEDAHRYNVSSQF